MNRLAGLSVLVLGLGDSGLAMARWCARHGARVRVWDSREQPPQRDALGDAGAFFSAPSIDASALGDAQLVLKGPGLAPTDPRIAALLDAAAATGIAVAGELQLFVRALAELRETLDYAPQLLAITGTNGKTTTTALTALLVERAGRRVATAGNIGPTLLATLSDALDAALRDDAAAPPVETDEGIEPQQPVDHDLPSQRIDEDRPSPPLHQDQDPSPQPIDTDLPSQPINIDLLPQVWVLELSSFQLHGVDGFEPDAAALLNITQDHLDWHGTMDAYVAAKARVFGTHGTMVVNRDDPRVAALAEPAPEPAAKGRARVRKAAPRPVIGFGLGAPQRAGDFGLVVDAGIAWLARATPDADGVEVHAKRLMPADALHIRGRHNAANALAALALCSAIGCPLGPLLHALREYRGEPHRVEFVAAVGGVEAFDDSKGTNVGATVAALDGLGADRAPGRLSVILGGDGKGQDFTPLAAPLARHARAVATIGRDAAAVEAAVRDALGDAVALERHDSLEAATRWCFERAQPGDAVLLSPACASLDMFRNYGHRAEVFVAAVREIAAERGEVL